jgi:8-oxo-dGTP pyrophosphatase MutT (NUDIX family)
MARRDYYDDPDAPAANSIVPAVTAVVTDTDDRVLLIHRTDNDRWALPGGGIELGENARDALVREVREETGIDVRVTGIVGIYSDPHHVIAYDDGEVRQQFSLCFTAEPTGGTLTGSSESREVRWVPVGDIETLDMHPAQRLRINHGVDRSRTAPYIG